MSSYDASSSYYSPSLKMPRSHIRKTACLPTLYFKRMGQNWPFPTEKV